MPHRDLTFTQCPFDECDWTTAEPIHEVEADAVAGGRTRFAVHLQVCHGAVAEPDPDAWADGAWQIALFPGGGFEWEDGEFVDYRLNLSGDDQREDA